MFFIITAAIAPALALLSFFYLRNEMFTEPRRSLVRAFISGAIITFPILFIQYVMEAEQVLTNPFVSNVLFSSALEEFFKWLVIFATIYSHVEFDDPYDGILYGVAVSLGFATVENVFYLISFGIDEAFIRAILPVSSHALFGVVMGYYFGKSKFSDRKRQKEFLIMAFVGSFLLHFSYNTILTIKGNFLYFMIPFMLFLWWFALRKVKRAHEHLMRHVIENSKRDH
jgi:protease PrsW